MPESYHHIIVKRLPRRTRKNHPSEKEKTRRYEILLLDGITVAGEISFDTRKKKYVYKQAYKENTDSAETLAEIVRFILRIMQERKDGTP